LSIVKIWIGVTMRKIPKIIFGIFTKF